MPDPNNPIIPPADRMMHVVNEWSMGNDSSELLPIPMTPQNQTQNPSHAQTQAQGEYTHDVNNADTNTDANTDANTNTNTNDA